MRRALCLLSICGLLLGTSLGSARASGALSGSEYSEVVSLLNEYRDVAAVARLVSVPMSALSRSERLLLLGAAARGEHFLRLLAREQAVSLQDLCRCREEHGSRFDRGLLALHSGYAMILLGESEPGRAVIEDALRIAPSRWAWEPLARVYLSCAAVLGDDAIEWQRLGDPARFQSTSFLPAATKPCREATVFAVLAFAPIYETGRLEVGNHLSSSPASSVLEEILQACGAGDWWGAAIALQEIEFDCFGIIDDPTGSGVRYVNPLGLLAMSRILGQVARTVGEVVVAELPASNERQQAIEWYARSCFYSSRAAEAEGIASQGQSARARLWLSACLNRRGAPNWENAPVAREADRIAREAWCARFEAIYHQTLPLREARKTATRLVVELEELLVHSSPAAGSSDGLGYDRASIPSYRSAIFEVTELGLATGGGDEFLALARIGSADFPPGTCKGRLDPAYLLVQCRLEWIASRNNWQQVLRIGHCLANSVENRPVLALDMVNRWTAALCIPPEGGKIGD